jgi:hypothetical protein
MNAGRRASEVSTKKNELSERKNTDSSEEREYSSHRDQLLGSSPTPEQIGKLEKALVEAYKGVLEYRRFRRINEDDLDFLGHDERDDKFADARLTRNGARADDRARKS